MANKSAQHLTGSVSTVGGDDVIKSPAINVSSSLAGRLPGLTAINTSSEPGNDDAVLRIRGVGTFGNSNPLIVVDGIPNRSLNRIDPATIENISVLKDASGSDLWSSGGQWRHINHNKKRKDWKAGDHGVL